MKNNINGSVSDLTIKEEKLKSKKRYMRNNHRLFEKAECSECGKLRRVYACNFKKKGTDL